MNQHSYKRCEPKPRVRVDVDVTSFGQLAIATHMGRFVACGVYVGDGQSRLTLFARL